jgi:hypothetical protein
LFLSLGFQNVLGGFLLAIVGGNEARFLDTNEATERTVVAVLAGAG